MVKCVINWCCSTFKPCLRVLIELGTTHGKMCYKLVLGTTHGKMCYKLVLFYIQALSSSADRVRNNTR